MRKEELSSVLVERKLIYSSALRRYVTVDLYLPKNITDPRSLSLLLINDGQDLEKMDFSSILDGQITAGEMAPVLCVGIHAGAERKQEYGTAGVPDFMGRGSKAKAYASFTLDRLIPYIHNHYCITSFRSKSFAGFSLGGLSAIDMVWSHPDIFSVAGVFSGSLWWRTKDLEDGYNEDTDRIIHAKVREGSYKPGLRFYFTTGSLDETADRNNNGIIDSIDDTLSLIDELKAKGYSDSDIVYTNFEDGRHDVETWARALPEFLKWGWPVPTYFPA
jgi:iron(III)-enterobactin esterase